MAEMRIEKDTHPTEEALADFLCGAGSWVSRESITTHIGSCGQCLDRVVAAYDAVGELNKKGRQMNSKINIIKRLNIYLMIAVVSFIFSFITPRFFLQLLAATLLFGIKCIVDSKSTRMLVMIYEAWKDGGPRGASDMLKTLESRDKKRF